MLSRPILLATASAALITIGVAAWALFAGGAGRSPGAKPTRSGPEGDLSRDAGETYGRGGGPRGAVFPARAESKGSGGDALASKTAAGESGVLDRDEAASPRRQGKGTAGSPVGEAGAGPEGTEAASDAKVAGEGPSRELLSGPRLTAALAQAIEESDLGALQGLLISGLTLDGTKLTQDDVSTLFDALGSTKDYGLEKLILTHLERIEGASEEKAFGYADYLVGSRNPAHADEVFAQLVKMGPETSFDAVREVYSEAPNQRLRGQALRALGDLKDPRAVPLIHQGLYSAPDAALARPYVDALARLGGTEAISSLVDYVSREGNEASLSALRDIQDADAAPLLAGALNGRSSAAYQRMALRQLRTLPDPRALDDLSRFMDGAAGAVLRETIDTVARIPDAAAVRVLERFAARQPDPALASFASRSASRLQARLENPSPTPPPRADRPPKASRG